MDEYLSTTATVAANKSEMTLKMYLEIIEEDSPQRSFLITEAPVSIFIWRDASEAREPYCEAVPTNGLKLAPKTYDSTDGNLCAHVLQSPESRETWRETCRQKALFMGKLVHNRLHIMFLSVAGFFSICMLPVAACLHPIQEALRTRGRPWRGLISASIFLTIMGGISFLAVLNAQSFHHCDPLFEVEKGRYDYAWGFTIAAFAIPSLFHLAVLLAFVLSCIKSRPAGIEEDEIELGIVRATKSRRQRLPWKPNGPLDVQSRYSEWIQEETGSSQQPPPYPAEAQSAKMESQGRKGARV